MMFEHFSFRNRQLQCESVSINDLADQYGTPQFVYSRAAFVGRLKELQTAFAPAAPLICYSLKCNPNLHIGRLMAEHGAGFDVTSGGELARALAAGGTPGKIVFAGVGKTDAELRAGLEAGVLLFNVESAAELDALADIAGELGRKARIALRVNPALPPKTHIKTDTSVKGTKFGLDLETVFDVAAAARTLPSVELVGLHMHLGSPINSPQPYREAGEKGVELIGRLRQQGHAIEYLNLGGGFGISYRREEGLPSK